jgi:hydrogenase expression/formation protein HypD
MLAAQIKNTTPKIEIQYSRLVKPDGNQTAQKVLKTVFKESNAVWRGIGEIKQSGLTFNKSFEKFNPLSKFDIKLSRPKQPKNCLCGAILLGVKKPKQCKLFAKTCTPSNPIGPCMVSGEGACAAVYKYETR